MLYDAQGDILTIPKVLVFVPPKLLKMDTTPFQRKYFLEDAVSQHWDTPRQP